MPKALKRLNNNIIKRQPFKVAVLKKMLYNIVDN